MAFSRNTCAFWPKRGEADFFFLLILNFIRAAAIQGNAFHDERLIVFFVISPNEIKNKSSRVVEN